LGYERKVSSKKGRRKAMSIFKVRVCDLCYEYRLNQQQQLLQQALANYSNSDEETEERRELREEEDQEQQWQSPTNGEHSNGDHSNFLGVSSSSSAAVSYSATTAGSSS
jgi:hypothetical protein